MEMQAFYASAEIPLIQGGQRRAGLRGKLPIGAARNAEGGGGSPRPTGDAQKEEQGGGQEASKTLKRGSDTETVQY